MEKLKEAFILMSKTALNLGVVNITISSEMQGYYPFKLKVFW